MLIEYTSRMQSLTTMSRFTDSRSIWKRIGFINRMQNRVDWLNQQWNRKVSHTRSAADADASRISSRLGSAPEVALEGYIDSTPNAEAG